MTNSNLVLGTSFSPESCESVCQIDPLLILEKAHRELGITDVRLGLRWDRIQPKKRASLSYYKRYIEYMLKNDFTITLNIGPIKVMRWPEVHIPDSAKKYIFNGQVVTPECELAKRSFDYFHRELSLLRSEYGKKLKSVTFQVENESFFRFGDYNILMSDEYLLSLIEIFRKYIPSSKLMFNSAGRRNLYEVLSLFKTLVRGYGFRMNDLTLGFNFYYKIPLRFGMTPVIDPLIFPLFRYMRIANFKKEQRERGFKLEISEAQFEPWVEAKSPGNSYKDFLYLLDRCSKFFPEEYDYKLVRLWGIEEFVCKMMTGGMTDEHREILKDIRRINKVEIV